MWSLSILLIQISHMRSFFIYPMIEGFYVGNLSIKMIKKLFKLKK
jgi:hypothetical protein